MHCGNQQNRNYHGIIFGGYIMKTAFELSYVAAVSSRCNCIPFNGISILVLPVIIFTELEFISVFGTFSNVAFMSQPALLSTCAWHWITMVCPTLVTRCCRCKINFLAESYPTFLCVNSVQFVKVSSLIVNLSHKRLHTWLAWCWCVCGLICFHTHMHPKYCTFTRYM